MTALGALAAVVAGAVGATARYAIGGAVQRRFSAAFPAGTLAVNLTGAFALGLAAGAGSPTALPTLTAVGFLGGFTTFSTWMIETTRLGGTGLRTAATLNIVLSAVGGITLAALGYSLV